MVLDEDITIRFGVVPGDVAPATFTTAIHDLFAFIFIRDLSKRTASALFFDGKLHAAAAFEFRQLTIRR